MFLPCFFAFRSTLLMWGGHKTITKAAATRALHICNRTAWCGFFKPFTILIQNCFLFTLRGVGAKGLIQTELLATSLVTHWEQDMVNHHIEREETAGYCCPNRLTYAVKMLEWIFSHCQDLWRWYNDKNHHAQLPESFFTVVIIHWRGRTTECDLIHFTLSTRLIIFHC